MMIALITSHLQRLKKYGFETKHTIADAVRDLKAAFEEGRLKNPIDNELYYNIRRMQALSLK